MAGIFDEIIDGINAKAGQTTAASAAETTPTQPASPAAAPATQPAVEKKELHSYSKSFDEKYGDKKKNT